ncbi:nuclease-related domain-containing DEAD/DEAH box helicase [Rhizobium leguminosarum]|uniref:nuclease-related domain-containing DEAD/DEAH box helicase n=1 Tax=Rhizobium leguminosarum TaxID=384 RepID=UPI0013F160A6|nr:NERD domain-containing protein [Rhizobium leguminosarum]MBY5340437.1 DUF2075 domain-containing protein [Rhizobium leguminosarum]
MAIFIPPVAPSDMEHNSEADFARALQAGLGAGFIVMHSLPWVNHARDYIGSPAREGEADFVILHRSHGVLIVEVKGGEIVLKGRKWNRVHKRHMEEIQDPVRQARRSLWTFKRRIQQICGPRLAEKTMITVAVGFPHCAFNDQPPIDLPGKAILTLDDMGAIEPAILRAFEAGGRQEELTADEFDAIIKVLAPEFRVYEPLKVGIDASSTLLARLTSQQLAVLRGFEANPRAIIEGVAGSGKTLLAMQRALSFAKSKHSVLFTCYNVELAKWIREELAGHLVENGGNITVSNFHRLGAELCKEAGIDFTPNQANPDLWWDQLAPDLLAQAAMLLHAEPAFDAVVIDEAQDFSPNWWDALEYLYDPGGPTWAFWDKAQSLRREPIIPPIKDAFRFHLETNCRNTRRIAVCASAAANVPSEPFDLAPLGRPPRVIVPPNASALSGLVQQELRSLLKEHRLAPKQIAVLAPTQRQNGPLSQVHAINGIPFTSDAAAWRANSGILWSTARSFKGLEADVILLCGFPGLGDVFTVSDLYVALTRARSHLVIVPRDRTAREILDHAIAVATTHGEEATVESLA